MSEPYRTYSILLVIWATILFILFLAGSAFADCAAASVSTNHTTSFDNIANYYAISKFTAACDGEIDSVSVWLATDGSPPQYTAAIYSDNAGTPDANIGNFSAAETIAGASATQYDFDGMAATVVNAGVYWVVLKSASSASYPNIARMYYDTGNTGHSKNSTNGSSWNADNNDDAYFEATIVTAAPPPPEPPFATTTIPVQVMHMGTFVAVFFALSTAMGAYFALSVFRFMTG